MLQGTATASQIVKRNVDSYGHSDANKWQSSTTGWLLGIALLALLNFPSVSFSQARKKSQSKKTPSQQTEPTLTDRMSKARADLLSAAKDYKKSLETLLALQEADVKTASDLVEKRKVLLEQLVISKKELEESERLLATAQDKAKDTKSKIGEADNLIAEASAEEQLKKLG